MRLLQLASGLVLAAALAACGTNGSDSAAPGTDAHDEADVAFATEMAQHHQQALQMVALTAGRPLDADFSSLAAQIKAAQAPQIEDMTGWLTSWGEPVPASTGMGDMGALDPATMPGMMTESQMSSLSSASDATFEQQWLKLMIQHHQGALDMAKTELSDGEFPDARALAQNITDTQSQEISEMQAMLKTGQ